MRLKVISVCLLLLFCLVIVFPGYGKPRNTRATGTETIVKTAATKSVYNVMLRCLSSGINMVEEERNSEQEDDDHAADEAFFPSYMHPVLIIDISLAPVFTGLQYTEQQSHTDIFSPPDLSA